MLRPTKGKRKQTSAQQKASRTNFALFQVRGAIGNLNHVSGYLSREREKELRAIVDQLEAFDSKLREG